MPKRNIDEVIDEPNCAWCQGKGTLRLKGGSEAHPEYRTETCSRCKGTGVEQYDSGIDVDRYPLSGGNYGGRGWD